MTGHLLRIEDLGRDGLARVLELSRPAAAGSGLSGRGVALFFEHPSARTRNAFEMAVFQLGGHPVSIRAEELGIDTRETAEDVARTLACYHSVIAGRVVRHSTLERMAAALDSAGVAVPVVNLLSDLEHPSQAVADLLTIESRLGSLEGRTLAYIGDANNVCRSLVAAAALSGLSVNLASPVGHCFSEEDLAWAKGMEANLEVFDAPAEAVAGAEAIYTDVWTSMGQEADRELRIKSFAGFSIDDVLLQKAAPEALVLHCLPAHRGEEISAEVLEGASSVVWEQAANRMHAARGILSYLVETSTGGAR